MKRHDYAVLGTLVLLGGFVWLRDPAWRQAAGDSLPILAALPLFVWLGRPWKWSREPAWLAPQPAIIAAGLFPTGVLLDSTLVLAVGWTALAWSWIKVRFAGNGAAFRSKLLVLPVLSFPWIESDFEHIGWWFRLSGAAAAEQLLAWGNFDVWRHGTYLSVGGFALVVEPACSGLNGLQSMLVAGAALAYVKLKRSPLFWWSFPLLVAASWMANLLRILSAALCGAVLPRASAAQWVGPLHLGAGWLALCAMFGLCWWLFAIGERLGGGGFRALERWSTGKPWLEGLLVGYGAWRCRELVPTWRDSPFDQLGWLACLIWLLPLLARNAVAGATLSERARLWLMGFALGLILLSEVGDVNVFAHAGLACAMVSLSCRGYVVIWALGAVAWWPAAGWVASRLGVPAGLFAALRPGLAAAASAWSFRSARQTRTSQTIAYADGDRITP
jgi:exosortase/archaeosortase family protein